MSRILVQWVGIAILAFGLTVSYRVVTTAWKILEDQQEIVSFAERIETASHVNGAFNSLLETLRKKIDELPTATAGAVDPKKAATAQADALQSGMQKLNSAYFAAWAITLTVLALVARIGLWMAYEGGRLTLAALRRDNKEK